MLVLEQFMDFNPLLSFDEKFDKPDFSNFSAQKKSML